MGFWVVFCKGILLLGTVGCRNAGTGRLGRCCRKDAAELEDGPPAERGIGGGCPIACSPLQTASTYGAEVSLSMGLWWIFVFVHEQL